MIRSLLFFGLMLSASKLGAQDSTSERERKLKELEDRALLAAAPRAFPVNPKPTHTARDLCACSAYTGSMLAYEDAVRKGDLVRQAKVLGNGNIIFLKEGTPLHYLETEKTGLVHCLTINPVQEFWTTAEKIKPLP